MRKGVSLAEVVALVGALLILFSLWLPRLVEWRESARRSTCRQNLVNIGLALQAYHAEHRCLPPGYAPGSFRVHKDGSATWLGEKASYAWSAFLLPQLGCIEEYALLEVGARPLHLQSGNDDRCRLSFAKPISVFQCPSNPDGSSMETAPLHPTRRLLVRSNGEAIPEFPLYGGNSSYVGNVGYFPQNTPGFLAPGAMQSPQPPKNSGNGIFEIASRIRFEDVTDGLSNTIAVGERAYFQGGSTWVGVPDVKDLSTASICLGRVYWQINEIPSEFWEIPTPDFEFATPSKGFYVSRYPSARGGFGSHHFGGAHFLMTDGSVRFLSNDIDFHNTIHQGASPSRTVTRVESLGVFQRLGIRNDGQSVESNSTSNAK